MKRVMGLDVGSKTIGVAVSDLMGWTAQGVETVYWTEPDFDEAVRLLRPFIEQYDV
ncbi:MAG: Holliday junction resolvase RuvX, partial [Exiguobacterium chiriqhucha]